MMHAINRADKWKFAWFLSLACVVLTSNAPAQDAATKEEENASGFEGTLGVEMRYDDNIFRSASGEQTSLISLLSPGLLARFSPSTHRFELEYSGELAAYSQSSADDYDDHEFRAGAYLELGRRSFVDLIAVREDAHENRGIGLSEGFIPGSGMLPDEPDEYASTTYLGRFTYGAPGTRGRLIFELGGNEFNYTNHRDRTSFFDRDSRYGGGTLYMRIMPNTSLLLDLRATEIEYSDNRAFQPSLDSNEYRYLLGATWDITGKTIGTVKVGYVEKSYADDARGRFSGPSWDVDIRWSPRSYSHFDFSTSRYPSEVNSVTGDLIDNTTYGVVWSHEWSERVTTRLASAYADQDFRGSVGARTQEFSAYGMTVAYEMRRWLIWEFGVNLNSRDSNIDQFDFDGTIVRLGATLKF